MAERPMATAPDRSVAALSTMVILIFLGFAPRAPSKAAPQHAMPPPMRRRSVSTVSIAGFLQNEKVQVSFSISRSSLFLDYRHGLASAMVGEVAGLFDFCEIDFRLSLEGIDRAFSRCPDRELEALQDPVAELDGPHDGVRAPHRDHVCAQGGEILVGADFDRLLRADLHAIVALPALLRLLVVGLHDIPVQGHEVVWADILTSSLILRLAAVTLLCNHITRHGA